MSFELTASMMCANYGHLAREVKELENAGIDSFHIDIMDGRFVANFAMSLNDLSYIAKTTNKPLDVHLMVEHPNNTVHLFLKELQPGDYHPSATLLKIINAGMVPGIAINPGTSIETIMEMLRIVDKVLVMSVNPGDAGQMYLPYVGQKIDRLLKLKDEMEFKIYWDGACSREKVLEYAPKGVDGFVLGTTLLFGKDRPYKDIINDIRALNI